MQIEDRVLMAQHDEEISSQLIKEYKRFISSCASKTLGRFITEHDDEMSVALIAFNEAIKKYDKDKGSFLSYANIIIKNRIIDYLRKENKNSNVVPFSALSTQNKDGEEKEFDIEDTQSSYNFIKYEIEALTDELRSHSISFFELANVSPKSEKTKKACFSIVKYIINNPILIEVIKKNDTLPIKTIIDNINVHRKVVERHRKYIIAVVIILTGEYENVATYFKEIEEV